RLEVVRHLEPDSPALAAASQRHTASVAKPFSFRLRRGFPGPMLFLLLLFFLFFLVITSVARSSARRRREEYERQSSDRNGDDQPGMVVGSPFDLLFGGSGWQSYEYDPQSGGWVDVSKREPEPPAEAQEQAHAQRRPQRRRQAPQSPLGSLFGGGLTGGLGGDGSGDFEIQPPDELTAFAD